MVSQIKKIILVDINRQIVDEWRKVFGALHGLEIICGNIFDQEVDAIVSPANSFGYMDGGLDGKIRDFFGQQIEEKVQSKIRTDFSGEILVGQSFSIETKHQKIRHLIVAPTMRLPSSIVGTVNAYLAKKSILKTLLAEDSIRSIAIPGLGALSGKLEPRIAAVQMFYAYSDVILGNTPKVQGWWELRDYENLIKDGILISSGLFS
jgi:O-acetyl-ADP-ribose deacetylase (regulator of RNase III)